MRNRSSCCDLIALAHQTGGHDVWATVIVVVSLLAMPVFSVWFLWRHDDGPDDFGAGRWRPGRRRTATRPSSFSPMARPGGRSSSGSSRLRSANRGAPSRSLLDDQRPLHASRVCSTPLLVVMKQASTQVPFRQGQWALVDGARRHVVLERADRLDPLLELPVVCPCAGKRLDLLGGLLFFTRGR